MATTSPFQWAVIGAGPAGIAAVGKLIDHGVNPANIVWVDPAFKVGDFGTKWQHVSSNTKVRLFNKFYAACHAFNHAASPPFPIHDANPDETCLLSLAAQPLQWITDHLKSQLHALQDKVLGLSLFNRQWHLALKDTTISAKNVIVATGAEPTSLNLPIAEIPLDIALDPAKLATACHAEDEIAVFGSSHSAIIVIQALVEKCNVKKIINFYLQPLRYAVYFDDWILFDDTGLKGQTATWARTHIDGILPRNLERVISNEENIRMKLPSCSKAIYSIGFQKRLIPVEGMKSLAYNERNGIIAPGLFGLGIAFPEAKWDRFGTLEYRVGLWKFMEYINHVMPVWLKYSV